MIGIASRVAARLTEYSRWGRLAVLGCLPRNGVGAEIGVHLGDYAARILAAARPRTLYLVDPWQCNSNAAYEQCVYGSRRSDADEMERRYRFVQSRFARRIASGQVRIMRKTSAEAMGEMRQAQLDFIYIDGNHLYEFAKQDLELSLGLVRSGGIIAGDDYTPGGWWKGGVKRAVDEFGWNDQVQLLWISGCQFVFRKR